MTSIDPSGPGEFAPQPGRADAAGLLASISLLLRGQTLSEKECESAFEVLAAGGAAEAEMGAFLALLATRVPTVEELCGAVRVMRRHVVKIESRVDATKILDTAGTGGARKTFNVSTAAAIVAASCGAKVAKHGNRSRTGRGSAEVLGAVGVNVDAPPAAQSRCLDEAGICFCFSIHHHPAAKRVMPARKALAFPTIFNLLGPMVNPAGAQRQLTGVYDARFLEPVARTLARLGSVRALVVHSDDGLDELSVTAPSRVAEVRLGAVHSWSVDPASLGVATSEMPAAPRNLDEAAALFLRVLRGLERGWARNMTLLNSAAALLAADRVGSIADGVAMAAAAIDFGDAWKTLDHLAALSGGSLVEAPAR